MITTDPDRRPTLASAVALAVSSTGCAVGLLATSAWLITRAAEHPPVLYLLVAVVGVRALGIFRGVFRYLERLAGHRVALHRQTELRLQAWNGMLSRSWIGRTSGDLLSRVVSDVGAVQDRIVRVVLPVSSAVVVVIITVGLLSVVSPAVGLWVMTCTLVGGLLLPVWAGRRTATQQTMLTELRSDLAVVVSEAADVATDLLVYGAVDHSTSRLDAVNRRLRGVEHRIAVVQGVVAAGQLITTAAAVCGALVIGSTELITGTGGGGGIDGPLLAVLVLTPLALHDVIAGLPGAVQTGYRTRSALARVQELTTAPERGAAGAAEPGVLTGPDDQLPADVVLRTRDLAIGYPDRLVATGIDLVVRRGERVGVTGPSGIGKSTLAATVLGLLAPRSGRVSLRGNVGYLAQDAHLFDTTVAENVRIGRADADDAAVVDALRGARLDLDSERLVGEHGSQVSGGEARRIALARLLVRDDDLVVLDEPTEHLDRVTAADLRHTLLAATRDRATMIISHDPELLGRCDRVVDLSAATPVRAGTTPVRGVAGSRRSR